MSADRAHGNSQDCFDDAEADAIAAEDYQEQAKDCEDDAKAQWFATMACQYASLAVFKELRGLRLMQEELSTTITSTWSNKPIDG